jgi:hypothetical protein
MKATEITCTAILSLLFGVAAPALGLAPQGDGQRQVQNEQSQQKPKDPRQPPAESARRSNPATSQPQEAGQHQEKPVGDRQRQRENRDQNAQESPRSKSERHRDPLETQQDRDDHRERDRHHWAEQDRHDWGSRQMPQHLQRGAWRERRARDWQFEHRTWQQRGGYRGYRVPGDRLGRYFGPRHGFRIYGLPFLVVGGYPRFQYGGYWIRFMDPWPEYWPDDWYETDDVYVAYSGDGYYLFNRQYPFAGIAVEVMM